GEPRLRYHWCVLPQGMKNSPSICQWYVASLLVPVRQAHPRVVIYHYMDNILVCAPTDKLLELALNDTTEALKSAGFDLQDSKVQCLPPQKYLGLQIGLKTITPQKVSINFPIRTLNDAQHLCRAISWVRRLLGLTNEDLDPLFNLLKGGDDLTAPRSLTPEAKQALEKVSQAISCRQAHRRDPDLPFSFIILGGSPHIRGLIFQWREKPQGKKPRPKGTDSGDPLLIIENTMPQELVASLIVKGRARIRELAGCDFACIHIPITFKFGPLTQAWLDYLLSNNEALQLALDSYAGDISIHKPQHKFLNDTTPYVLKLESVQSKVPLKALTVFTDASGSSHKSVITWKDPETLQWETDVKVVEGSPQIAELDAVVRAFRRFSCPFNLVTNSAYVAGVVSRFELAALQEVANPTLFSLLSELRTLVSHREHPFYVLHVRPHTDLPGFIAEGNRRADALAAPAVMAPLPDIFQQAKISHQLHHQNAPGLVWQFDLTRNQARAIVATCPQCQKNALPSLGVGVNPQGLHPCELWQMDVTHVPSFGRVKFVHVSVDTFSGALFASAHAGEK
ncbi:POK11 protein, partial [Chloropsis hardwickii]|nr:POK11 protein [Chloropsis hardwickii]